MRPCSLWMRQALRGKKPGRWYTLPRIYEVSRCVGIESTFLIHSAEVLMDANGGDYVVAESELTRPITIMRKVLCYAKSGGDSRRTLLVGKLDTDWSKRK